MPIARTFAALAVLVSVLLGCAGAGAVVVRLPDGATAGVQVRGDATAVPSGTHPVAQPARAARAASATTSTPGGVMYYGGPVLHTTRDYLVLWDPPAVPAVPQPSLNLISRYLSDVSANAAENDVFGVARQYSDSAGFAGRSQFFSPEQVVADAQSYPSPAFAPACPQPAATNPPVDYAQCLTDSEIQTELTRLVTTDRLPAGSADPAPVYIVLTPPGVDVCLTAGSCADQASPSGFCAYHSAFTGSAGTLLYVVLPWAAITPNPKECQTDTPPGSATSNPLQEPNADPADVTIDNLSHELNETITDPLGDAWQLPENGVATEIADLCEQAGPPSLSGTDGPTDPNAYAPTLGGVASQGTLYDQSIAGDHYYTQTAWSNGDGGCRAAPAPGALVPAFTAPPVIARGVSGRLRPAAAPGAVSTTWSFGDGTSAFAATPPASTDHAFRNPGTYTVTLTEVDDHGNVASATGIVRVAIPLLVRLNVRVPRGAGRLPASREHLTFTTAGSRDPNVGARIRSIRWSFGNRRTAAGASVHLAYRRPGTYTVRVTMTDSLGLTVTRTRRLLVQRPGTIVRVTNRRIGGGLSVGVRVTGPGRIRLGRRSVTLRRPGVAVIHLPALRGLPRRLHLTFVPLAGPEIKYTDEVTIRS